MVPERIRELRVHLGMTQEEFAKKVGLHPVTLTKIENGTYRYNLSRKTLNRIAVAFHVTVEWLEGPKPTSEPVGIYVPPERPKIFIDDSFLRSRIAK